MKDLILVAVAGGLGSCGQLLLKVGMTAFGPVSATAIWGRLGAVLLVPQVWLGFCCFGLSAVLWLAVVSRAEISFAYPIASGISYLILLTAAGAWLGEQVSWVRVLGVLLICAGVGAITRT